jgi:phage terminase large subunit-like protein
MGRDPEALSPWSFACPDWVERLQQGKSLVPDLPLDQAAADRAVNIFNNLRIPDVVGQPAMADAAGEWVRDIIRAVFGSIDPADGRRHVAEVFGLVPKKNAKTTNGAGIMMTALLDNERPRAEFLLVGPTQEIADLAFQQASGMIDADPEGYLQKRFQVQEHLKTIVDRRTKAKLKIKTFDMKVMTGSKPVGVLLDEVHIMSTYSYASRVVGQIRGGLIANPESFLIMITTQSDEPPAGVFRSELQYARGVRDGRIANAVRLLPVLYEFPEAMQVDPRKPWADPRNWPMVTPNLGLSVSLDRMAEDYTTAKEKGEEEERRWASQHLNVEIGLALHSARWRGADFWLKATEPKLTLKELMRRSEVCVVGGDGGGLDDLFAACVMGREKHTRRWLVWVKAWVHPEALLERPEIAERLRDFAKDGDLVICKTPTQDIEEFADLVEQLAVAGLLPDAGAVGLDPQGVAALVDALVERDITEDQMVGVAQGYRLNGAILGAERKLKDGTLVHAPQALMAWCIGNIKAEQRGNAVLITKQAAGKAKIDPPIAMFNAVDLMSRNPESVAGDFSDFVKNAVMVA